jgi:hypothetical protein
MFAAHVLTAFQIVFFGHLALHRVGATNSGAGVCSSLCEVENLRVVPPDRRSQVAMLEVRPHVGAAVAAALTHEAQLEVG